MDKDHRYWETHKKLWQEQFDDLDFSVQKKIMESPDCDEAKHFEHRLNILVKEKVSELSA